MVIGNWVEKGQNETAIQIWKWRSAPDSRDFSASSNADVISHPI